MDENQTWVLAEKINGSGREVPSRLIFNSSKEGNEN